ncbi:MAG: hypothetical protein MO852_06955 [Candidatus Devosia euplotis]|nr:hypothetical protein [Candidatus Devosia euplotis]
MPYKESAIHAEQANIRFIAFVAVSVVLFLLLSLILRWEKDVAAVPKTILLMYSISPIIALLTPPWALWRML